MQNKTEFGRTLSLSVLGQQYRLQGRDPPNKAELIVSQNFTNNMFTKFLRMTQYLLQTVQWHVAVMSY